MLAIITSLLSFYLFFFKLIYFWLCWVFIAVHGLSLVVVGGGLLFTAVQRLLIVLTSPVAKHRL